MEMMEKMEKMGQTEMKTTTKIAEVLHLCHHLDRLAAIRQQKKGDGENEGGSNGMVKWLLLLDERSRKARYELATKIDNKYHLEIGIIRFS
jgi:hypothetical protein